MNNKKAFWVESMMCGGSWSAQTIFADTLEDVLNNPRFNGPYSSRILKVTLDNVRVY